MGSLFVLTTPHRVNCKAMFEPSTRCQFPLYGKPAELGGINPPGCRPLVSPSQFTVRVCVAFIPRHFPPGLAPERSRATTTDLRAEKATGGAGSESWFDPGRPGQSGKFKREPVSRPPLRQSNMIRITATICVEALMILATSIFTSTLTRMSGI